MSLAYTTVVLLVTPIFHFGDRECSGIAWSRCLSFLSPLSYAAIATLPCVSANSPDVSAGWRIAGAFAATGGGRRRRIAGAGHLIMEASRLRSHWCD